MRKHQESSIFIQQDYGIYLYEIDSTAMTSNLLISIAVILLTSTDSAFSQTPDLITDHFNALAKHDVKAIAYGYADSAKMYSPNWEGAKTGQAGIMEVYTRYFASTPDLSYKVNHIIDAGDYMVAEYTVSGTLSKPEGNTPANMKDKKYTLDYCAVFKIEAGKIIKETIISTRLLFYGRLAFLISINRFVFEPGLFC